MIEQNVVIPNATASAVYEVLMDGEMHSELTGDIAKIDPKVGGKFTTFSGYSEGKTTRLEPEKLIEQTWRASDWPEGHYSTIKFKLSDVEGGTQIHFTQINLPEGSQKEFEAGWQDNYWNPLEEYFAEKPY